MSALDHRKLKPGSGEFCLNRCESGRLGLRPASHEVFIAGHPAGFLCAKCCKAWKAAWSGAQVTLRVRSDPFQTIWHLRNPDVVESVMWGPCLRGGFRPEGTTDPWDPDGFFRMDRLDLIEPVPYDQLELAA